MFVGYFPFPLAPRLVLTIRDLVQHNILINAQGKPCLADFGLSSIADSVYSITGLTPTGGGTARWSAPELMGIGQTAVSERGRSLKPTTQSDIYFLAMVIVEVISRFNAPCSILYDLHFPF